MAGLYLVGSANGRRAEVRRGPVTPPFDLARQPQRPGELCREVRLPAGADQRVTEVRAAAAGVPASLWATLAVESERCVQRSAALFALPDTLVVAALEDAAAEEEPETVARLADGTPSRLCDYARALLNARSREAAAVVGGVVLRPSLTMLTAWSLASRQAGLKLEAWASSHLSETALEPVRWEGSAALSGQTLAEWTVLQAARRLRSARTRAHSAG